MDTKNLTPNAEQVAQQFNAQALAPRLEMMIPYGREEEHEDPTASTECDWG